MSTLRRFLRRDATLPDPADAAVHWAARKQLGMMSGAEELRFQAWLQDPAHRAAYEALDGTADLAGGLAADPDIRRMRTEALTAAPAPGRPHLQFVAVGTLVGAVVAIVAIGLTGFRPQDFGHWDAGAKQAETVADAEPAAATPYITGTGETRVVTLNDGSVVTLNTTSVLEVDYSATERGVRLLEGQALFQVAKEALRPFVVAAGDRRITALGTSFDVRVDRDRVAVVLVEGHAVVDALKPEGLARVIPALARYGLGPGEQLVASADNDVAVTTADTERAMSWRRGQLVFRDDTIADAVAEMNRYSTIKFVVDDPGIAHLRISGVFKTARPDNLIAALTSSYPLVAERRSPLVTALVRRD